MIYINLPCVVVVVVAVVMGFILDLAGARHKLQVKVDIQIIANKPSKRIPKPLVSASPAVCVPPYCRI
jgi:hypothetical protein